MVQKILVGFILLFLAQPVVAQHSTARQWNEQILEAIRNDFARPTVHARNLFHSSVIMYDIWSVVSDDGDPFFLGDTIGSYISQFPGFDLELEEEEKEPFIDEAISYAIFELMSHRFQFSPGAIDIFGNIDSLMADLGYDPFIVTSNFPEDSSAAAFGRYVAEEIIVFGLQDGAQEINDYRNAYYRPSNAPLIVDSRGNGDMNDPNRWQPLAFDVFIDQSGNIRPGDIPDFLSPEWGNVVPFALSDEDLVIYTDSKNDDYWVYKDPGPPPYLTEDGMDQGSEDFRWGFSLVAVWSSMLDPTDGVLWDISPASIGNVPNLPENFEGYDEFYDLFEGGDPSLGWDQNPVTGQPYEPQMVPRADYARVLAEFWADGPDSETPPGHWFTILHEVMDHPMFERKWQGSGAELDELEYDVKAFFTLGGAMHDAAVSTWGIKGWYDYVRPVSVIRYMASKGQSTDTTMTNYDPHGLPIIPGYIETIMDGDELEGDNKENVGLIKMRAWRGPDFIDDPAVDVAGVGWILADGWWPYQRPTFVSPPFAGYTSGHSCYSRAAAEVLTLMTGDEFFPGGVGIFPMKQNDFLVFESGPSVDMELQWATYRDASDQTSLSRIWGGIHPPQDDIPGRIIGIDIGIDAFNKANSYFSQVNSSTFEQTLIEEAFQVFPNPISSTERLTIQQKEDEFEVIRVELYDWLARRVRSEKIRPGITSLDMRGLPPGSYLLHLIGKDLRQFEEVIVID